MTLRVLVKSSQAHQHAFLETVLAMETPGMFEVVQEGPYDVALVAMEPGEHPADMMGVTGQPFILVPPSQPALADVDAWMRQGAHDVLGMGEITARRLAAAVIKAAERSQRTARAGAHQPVLNFLPAATPHGTAAGGAGDFTLFHQGIPAIASRQAGTTRAAWGLGEAGRAPFLELQDVYVQE